MDNQIDGYTAAEKKQDQAPHWTFAEPKAVSSNDVDDVMTNEDIVIEIISNNEDCQSSIMDMMSIQVAATMTSKLTMDQAQSLARASMDLIGLVEKHAEGYVK
jgi:hypothetical protein